MIWIFNLADIKQFSRNTSKLNYKIVCNVKYQNKTSHPLLPQLHQCRVLCSGHLCAERIISYYAVEQPFHYLKLNNVWE